ncbi:MAG: ATP-binding protein [Planctomycetota bacterium]
MSETSTVFRREHTLRELRAGLELVQNESAGALEERGYDEGARFAIRLALEEAVVNAFRHGNRLDPAKVVFFRADIDRARAVFEVEDQGPGFDPATIPDPTHDENLEIPSGRGVMLIKAYMTEVEYLPPGNRLRMTWRKPAK